MNAVIRMIIRSLGSMGLVLILGTSSGCQTRKDDSTLSILFQVKIRGGYGIYRLDTEGVYPDSVAVLRGDAVQPSWSPDRSRFVFSSYRNGHFDLAIADADGGNLRYLTADTAEDLNTASFFPDGTRVVFTTNRNGNLDVYTINTDGTGLAPLVADSSNDWQPVVTSNGKLVVFVSDRTGVPRLWVLDVATATRQLVMTQDTMTAEFEPCISPDGRFLAFSFVRRGNRENFDIAEYDLTNRRVRHLINDPATDRWPRYSADGSKILFHSARTGTSALYVYDRATRETRALNTRTINSSFGDW